MKFEPPHLLAIECNSEDPASVTSAVARLAEIAQDLHGLAFTIGMTFASVGTDPQNVGTVLRVALDAHERAIGRSPLAEMVRGGMESWDNARTPSADLASTDGA